MKALGIILLFLCTAYAQVRRNPCENLPDGNGFVNDYSHCPAYYSCSNFLPFIIECPAPFYFQTTGLGTGICQWPDVANCEPCPALGLLMVHVRDSCTDFTLCVDGAPFERSCPPGELFDRQLGLCLRADLVDCPYQK